MTGVGPQQDPSGPRLARRVVRVGAHAQPAVPIPWPQTREGPAGGVSDLAGAGRAPRRVLVAGVGYSNLSDLSVGPVLVQRLQRHSWPDGVQVEDLSFGGVHVLHWLQEALPFDAAVFVAGVARGREPGSVHRSAWAAPDVSAEEVQARVAEAVTGIISLETLLTVLGYFGVLPPPVTVIEVEPRDQGWGPAFSAPVEAALAVAEAQVERAVAEVLAA